MLLRITISVVCLFWTCAEALADLHSGFTSLAQNVDYATDIAIVDRLSKLKCDASGIPDCVGRFRVVSVLKGDLAVNREYDIDLYVVPFFRSGEISKRDWTATPPLEAKRYVVLIHDNGTHGEKTFRTIGHSGGIIPLPPNADLETGNLAKGPSFQIRGLVRVGLQSSEGPNEELRPYLDLLQREFEK